MLLHQESHTQLLSPVIILPPFSHLINLQSSSSSSANKIIHKEIKSLLLCGKSLFYFIPRPPLLLQNMISSVGPSKILVGISLDPDESKDVLSWAINVLAQPGDTVVALHVLVGEEPRKLPLKKKKRAQIRHAKAHVISVLGEFTKTFRSKQVNLEARVRFSSSIRRGLIEEVKSISADYLVLCRSRNHEHRISHVITRYASEFALSSCSVILVGKQRKPQNDSDSDSAISKEIKREKSSPRTVLNVLEGESNSSGDDNSSFTASTVSSNFPSSDPDRANERAAKRKPMSPYKLISSFFNSPLRKWRGNVAKKKRPQPLIRCFSYDEISKATNNFHKDNIVGVGGYSEVYRGDLSDGRRIAVKRLAKDNNDMNKEKEFLTELGIISHVSHPNTANLLGCCIERGLHLIFKFSENGNLYSALHENDKESLDWPIRYKIALGVARGLHYLHKRCKHRIIHRDIKASNVLLGADYEPQITDFGLAKWLPNKWTHHAVIPVEGTFGYLAPEYFMHGIVDEKTDVFAFGILLLEIITGRRPVDSSQQNILLWAKPLMENGNTRELADPRLEGKYDEHQMHRLILTASFCFHRSSVCRPSMIEVLELLTTGNEAEIAKNRNMSKLTSDELDDCSMVFGYDIPLDSCLDETF